ncbi:MAG: DMT family transporter [Kiritimatiellaeota bacterium]|nr:DMT family transporter [Kiritimatiellota bacterium]
MTDSFESEGSRHPSPPPGRAWGYAIAAAFLWSTVASAFKLALRDLSVLALLRIASLTSVLVLLMLVVLQGKLREFFHQGSAGWRTSALFGLLNPFLYYFVLFNAYRRLPAQEAQPLNNAWPVVLSLLAVPILKQRLPLRRLLPLLVSFMGVVVISVRGDFSALEFSDPLGCALALGSAVIWAAFWLGNARDRRQPAVAMLTNFLAGTCYIYLVSAFSSESGGGSPLSVGAAVYVGCFEMGFTFLLWGRAVTLSRGAAAVNNLAYLSPFISLVFIHFIVGEQIRTSSVMGLALIVGGVLLQALVGRRFPESPA